MSQVVFFLKKFRIHGSRAQDCGYLFKISSQKYYIKQNLGQYPSPFGLNNNLGKILGNLPPQIRENPAALAQIMNGSPLFGLPGMSNPLLGIPNLPKPATPYESDEEDKNKIQNQIRDNKNQVPIGGLLHQQQQVNKTYIFELIILAQNEKDDMIY